MTIDLNCDMGEGCGNDAAIMPFVSSANIACGFHAGDKDSMRRTVDLALEHGVAIGAHPGYRDRENFGRTALSLPPTEVYDIVREQLEAISAICYAAGAKMDHVKPHGALYNQAANDSELARAIIRATADIDAGLTIYALSGSRMIREIEDAGMRPASEIFADRSYRSDGSLTPRTEADALISEPIAALRQVLEMLENATVAARDGSLFAIVADTICIHGDGANALEFVRAISEGLRNRGISICPPPKR